MLDFLSNQIVQLHLEILQKMISVCYLLNFLRCMRGLRKLSQEDTFVIYILVTWHKP